MSAGRAGIDVVGVVGAGTMGSGIAQLACLAGARTLLHDPDDAALERGAQALRANLAKGAERGRWSAADAERAAARLEPAATLEALAPCELVIEAAPERLELKRELFARLSEIVAPDCVLATNTSSLLVTALAAAASHPERVVGMHFFNPAPLMRLLEVVAGEQSGAVALASARALGAAMGKLVIDAHDGPGFLVNRCNRPFSLEALRLVSERIAPFDEVDRICRLGGGFAMGPFELMDLVGVDVGFEIAQSFFAQSFGEPRWRPSPLSARMVAAGRTGRKVGHGFYDYRDGPHRPPDPAGPEPRPPSPVGSVVITGATPLADVLRERAAARGWEVRASSQEGGKPPFLILDCAADGQDPRHAVPDAFSGDTRTGAAVPPAPSPRAVACHAGSLAVLDPGGTAVGFHALAPFAPGTLVELTRGAGRSDARDASASAAEQFFATLGGPVAWVGDAPGLVLGRIVCQLVNEAAFAVGEGVGTPADVDAGFVHGLNYPRGMLAWADEIGLGDVLAVLDALRAESGEERYRAAPLLRRLALAGRLGRSTGEGFFRYDEGST